MKPASPSRSRGFTLLETVIAIGVLAVLLTGFIVVFTPAADGIRKSLNLQQADRMASAVEQELVTLRTGQGTAAITNGFRKAFDWIQQSNKPGTAANAVFVYQYRGAVSNPRTSDGTPTPVVSLAGKVPGVDYVVVPMCRRIGDTLFADDLTAVEGAVYLVKCTQLVFNGGQLVPGTAGTIVAPKTGVAVTSPDDPTNPYPEAVIAFTAEFYTMPAKTKAYLSTANTTFTNKFFPSSGVAKNPVFTRNLAVRR